MDWTPGGRTEGDRECKLAIASLGFPIVFLTLLAHGGVIYLVRQGHWLPSPAAEGVWTGLVAFGLVTGLVVSAWPGSALKKN